VTPHPQKRRTLSISSGEEVKENDKSLRAEEIQASTIEDAKNRFTTGSKICQKTIFVPAPEIAEFFAKKTQSLINAKSFGLVSGRGKIVDIVKDVVNLLPVHWICHIVSARNLP
jgi:hypothetical protein